MSCLRRTRNLAMWTAIAVAITAASMSSSKPRKAHISTVRAEAIPPRVSLTFPLN